MAKLVPISLNICAFSIKIILNTKCTIIFWSLKKLMADLQYHQLSFKSNKLYFKGKDAEPL